MSSRPRWWLDAAVVAIVAGFGAASIVLGPPSGTPALQWALVESAAVALVFLRRFPVLVVAVEVALVVLGELLLDVGVHVAPLAAAFALGVVTLRHGWTVTGVCWAAVFSAVLFSVARDGTALLTGANGLVFVVALALAIAAPVAFGRYLAGLRQAAVVAEERAREAEERRRVEGDAAREAERARIAGDLHDLVAHHVSAIALRAGSAQYAATHGPDDEQRLREAVVGLRSIHTSARQALLDLRGMLRILRDPADEGPLVDPEKMIADAVELSRTAGLEIAMHLDERAAGTPLSLRVTAARVVQEALTNALKHAGPGTHVETSVAVDGSGLRIDVANSVPGGPPPVLPASGHGLEGMRRRVELHGGTMDAGPTPAGGWRLRVTLPPAVPS